jgi:FkbM family methyltransferase
MTRYDLNFIILGITEHSNIKPTNIFEIGSRDGHDAHTLAQAFRLPDSACHVFEPNPKAYADIAKNYPTMNAYQTAISDVEGEATFYVEPNNIGMSSLLHRMEPGDTTTPIQVECRRMDTLIESWGVPTIDVCKIDVEGATLNVLKGFGKHLDKLQSIQIEAEYREVWKGQVLYPEIREWLTSNGYIEILFCLARKYQYDSFWLRNERMLT